MGLWVVGYTDKFEKTGDPSMLHVSQRSPLCGFPGEIMDELFLQQCTMYLDHSNVPGILAFKTRHVEFHMADNGPCSDEVAIVKSMGDDRDVGDGEVLILKVLRPPYQATCCIVVSLVLTGVV